MSNITDRLAEIAKKHRLQVEDDAGDHEVIFGERGKVFDEQLAEIDSVLSAYDAQKGGDAAVAEVVESGYMNRAITWLPAADDLPDGKYLLFTHPEIREVTADDAEHCTRIYAESAVKVGHGDDVRTVGVDPECMKDALESFRARLMGDES